MRATLFLNTTPADAFWSSFVVALRCMLVDPHLGVVSQVPLRRKRRTLKIIKDSEEPLSRRGAPLEATRALTLQDPQSLPTGPGAAKPRRGRSRPRCCS